MTHSGSGTITPIPLPAPGSGGSSPCGEYLTVAAVRAEHGADVADLSDEALQRQIDQMSAFLEDQLGHTFGRALFVHSTEADTLQVTDVGLAIGGDGYAFADYPTLLSLANALNTAGQAYSAELLPNVRGDTPSTLLKIVPLVTCGPDYSDRVVLCVSDLYVLLSGQRTSYLFLPLAVGAVTSVVENGLTLGATDYYATAGDTWLVRKTCGCLLTNCGHAHGCWSGAYPANIAVTYQPALWVAIPTALSAQLLDAFAGRAGLAPYASEQFGDYSYRRQTAHVATWQETLGAGSLRRYTVRFHP